MEQPVRQDNRGGAQANAGLEKLSFSAQILHWLYALHLSANEHQAQQRQFYVERFKQVCERWQQVRVALERHQALWLQVGIDMRTTHTNSMMDAPAAALRHYSASDPLKVHQERFAGYWFEGAAWSVEQMQTLCTLPISSSASGHPNAACFESVGVGYIKAVLDGWEKATANGRSQLKTHYNAGSDTLSVLQNMALCEHFSVRLNKTDVWEYAMANIAYESLMYEVLETMSECAVPMNGYSILSMTRLADNANERQYVYRLSLSHEHQSQKRLLEQQVPNVPVARLQVPRL